MKESDSGFSFGAPMDGDPDETHDIDAIEVSSEPVSRNEAKNLGLGAHDATRRGSREDKSSSALMRMGQLPKDLSGDLTEKLESAWNHLNRNEVERALTLAQEVVWEYPALVAPKLIIARCFINRKEYDKALSLLQAIGDGDMNAETLYYIGLCQSRIGRIGEAMEALKLSRASSTDPETRKRAGDLMQHLQGEQIVCPVCGRKSLYDSMVDVGSQTVCAKCARKMEAEEEEEEEDDWDDGEESRRGGRARKKRLRPPLTKTDVLMRMAAACSILVLAWIVLYVLSLASPRVYASVRVYVPDWSRLPAAQTNFLPEGGLVPSTPQLLPSIAIDSPPLKRAIVGVELRHQVYIESPDNREWEYGLAFHPQPTGQFGLDAATGDFHWTPAEADVGRTFEITFSAMLKTHRARDQVNQVSVSPGPRFNNIVNWTAPKPGESRHIAAADLDGDGSQEVILATGAVWEGEMAVFGTTGETAASDRQRIAGVRLPGRSAGLGVIRAADEQWIAVADYWNSRLRYYALRNGSLSEMAVDIDLPGRPILAAFDADSSTSAVLCRNREANHLIVHRQEGQLDSRQLGDWSLPGSFVWRRILLLPGRSPGAGAASRFLVLGGDAAESIYLVDEGDAEPVQLKLGISGTLVDAAADNDGEVFCLIMNEGGLRLYRFTLDAERKPVLVGPVSAGDSPALGGFAVLPTEKDEAAVAFVLSATSLGLSIASSGAGAPSLHYWALPLPSRLLGQAAVIPGDKARAPRVAYFDEGGGVWAVDISASPRAAGQK